MKKNKLVVGISGASCAAISICLLEAMAKLKDWETHLVITSAGEKTIALETKQSIDYVKSLATHCYSNKSMESPIASGSFITNGMVVVPCSMKTVAGIATGYSDNLLLRAADVTLKEKRPLVLVARESPLSTLHLNNLKELSSLGATVLPPMLSMYFEFKTIDEYIWQFTAKILKYFRVDLPDYKQWGQD